MWQLQEAKAQFSEVVRKTQTNGPQSISVRGKLAVMVISAQEYETLKRQDSLVDFFQQSPLAGVDLDVIRSTSLPRDIVL